MRTEPVKSLACYPRLNQRFNHIIDECMEKPIQLCVDRCVAKNREPNRLNTFPLCLSALEVIWLAGKEILSAAGRAVKESPRNVDHGGLFRGFRLLFSGLESNEIYDLAERRLNYESRG